MQPAAPALVIARAPGCPVRPAACENRIDYRWGDERSTGVFGYTAAGQIAWYCEAAADGTVRFDLTRSYDDRGRRTHQVEDVVGLGAGHREVTWDYDDADRVRRYRTDMDGEIHVSERTFDDRGRLARVVNTDGDRRPETVTYRYSEGDPLVVDEQHDTGSDGQVDWGWRYAFRGGRWLARIDNLGADGTSRAFEWYTYDPAVPGRLVRRDFDTDGDGTRDDVTQIAWPAHGSTTHVTFDIDGNGAVDQIKDYTVDRAGRVTRRVWSSPIDHYADVTTATWRGGMPDLIERRAADGELLEQWAFDRGCDGDRPMTLRLAGVASWDEEVDARTFVVDARGFWGFPEVL